MKRQTPEQRALEEAVIATTPLPPGTHSCKVCECQFFHKNDLQAHISSASTLEDRNARWKPAKYGGEYIDSDKALHLKEDIKVHSSIRGEYLRNGLTYKIMQWKRGEVILRK